MKKHHEVGHFKNRLMIGLLSLGLLLVMVGQSFAAMTCSSCHGMPPQDSALRSPTTGSFKGDHQKHATAAPESCTQCHGNSGYTMDHAAKSGYMIKMNANINNSPAGGTYGTKGTSFPQTATPVLESCSNVNCHFEKTGAAAPIWGTSTVTNCNSCHDSQPTTGNHTKHIGTFALGAAITCSTCHPNYGASSFSHATSAGKHPIAVNLTNNYGGVGVTSISWLPSQPKNYGNCSTYCHSNGTSPTGHTVTRWGNTSTGCNFCHPNLSAGHTKHVGTLQAEISFYNYTSNKSTAAGNKFGCANCHPLTLADHIDGAVDVVMSNNASGVGSLRAKNGAWTYVGSQCNNVYCHSNGLKPTYTFALTPTWGGNFTGDRCAACHGNSPNTGGKVGSNAHTSHEVGIHYADIFNGVSKKLPLGGSVAVNAAHGRNSRSTTINCNICHALTVSTFGNDQNPTCSNCHKVGGSPAALQGDLAVANASLHVNGLVDVNFINQKIATKAQVANSAFAAYTANTSGWVRRSNAMKFKTYTSSYDYTKYALSVAASPYTSAAGCLNIACHASIPVKWTDAVTCTSCHTRLK